MVQNVHVDPPFDHIEWISLADIEITVQLFTIGHVDTALIMVCRSVPPFGSLVYAKQALKTVVGRRQPC